MLIIYTQNRGYTNHEPRLYWNASPSTNGIIKRLYGFTSAPETYPQFFIIITNIPYAIFQRYAGISSLFALPHMYFNTLSSCLSL